MRKPPLPPDLERLHDEAVRAGKHTYRDPKTGYLVLTRLAHEWRGRCCGNRCRHCPFDWQNVPRDLLLVLVTFLLGAGLTAAQIPADTVRSLHPGTMQTNGQGPVFFPQNVFRGPSAIGTETVPDADPREICSIGLGGSIVIGFRQALVVDGPGPDLRIVENVFRYANGRIYAEPARVEVSRDAQTWFAFPFDSASLRGCAGVTPLGDDFDLATIGVDSVRWVRITDVTSIVRDDPRHAFFDPTLTGFDLDVVLGLHLVPAAFELDVADVVLSTMIRIASPIPSTLSVFTIHGARVRAMTLPAGRHDVDLADLPPGAYLVIVDDGREHRTLKVLR